jgi:hypothetical protein
MVLPEFAWMAGKIFGLTRATYFTTGELGPGNAEFSEPDEENIFCLNPNSELKGGSGVLCLAGFPGHTPKGKAPIVKRFSSKPIPADPEESRPRGPGFDLTPLGGWLGLIWTESVVSDCTHPAWSL